MNLERRLAWIQRNRERKDRAVPGSAWVEPFARRFLTDRVAEGLVTALGNVVDREFRQHCRVDCRPDRTLLISVDEPGLTGWMQRRWSMQLKQSLGKEFGIRQVRFTYGHVGQRIS